MTKRINETNIRFCIYIFCKFDDIMKQKQKNTKCQIMWFCLKQSQTFEKKTTQKRFEKKNETWIVIEMIENNVCKILTSRRNDINVKIEQLIQLSILISTLNQIFWRNDVKLSHFFVATNVFDSTIESIFNYH